MTKQELLDKFGGSVLRTAVAMHMTPQGVDYMRDELTPKQTLQAIAACLLDSRMTMKEAREIGKGLEK